MELKETNHGMHPEKGFRLDVIGNNTMNLVIH